MGSKVGFKDAEKAQVHSMATSFMNHCLGSVHENVQGYDGSHLEKNCDHSIDMALTFVSPLRKFWDLPILDLMGKDCLRN